MKRNTGLKWVKSHVVIEKFICKKYSVTHKLSKDIEPYKISMMKLFIENS